MVGRFAPSPTGDLHLGNLRTALVAWLAARSTGRGFLVRIEDLDRATSSPDHERRQLDDLAELGIDHDGPVLRQSDRFDLYHDAIADLAARDLVYPCYCSRREIRAEVAASASAPHGAAPAAGSVTVGVPLVPDGAYPGTCRELTRERRAEREATGRQPSLRLRADGVVVDAVDALVGPFRGLVDDFVVCRSDGVPAYNVAVVVDDAAQGVTQVVRGDDLLSSTARHVHLQRLLGLAVPEYAHVPLVLGDDGVRMAKRHGAVTLAELAASGTGPADVLRALASSLDLPGADEATAAGDLLEALGGPLLIARLPPQPVVLSALSARFSGPDPTGHAGQG